MRINQTIYSAEKEQNWEQIIYYTKFLEQIFKVEFC